MSSRRIVVSLAAALLATVGGGAVAQEPPHEKGAVLQRGGAVPQNPAMPPFSLSTPQREQVRLAVISRHNDAEADKSQAEKLKDFQPRTGEKLPTGIDPDGFPEPVLTQVPALRDYSYVVIKDQVVIVNAMTREIVDVFPDNKPATAG